MNKFVVVRWLLVLLIVTGCQGEGEDTKKQKNNRNNDLIDLIQVVSSLYDGKGDCVDMISKLAHFWTMRPSATITLLRLFTYRDREKLLQTLRNGLDLPSPPVSSTIAYLSLVEEIDESAGVEQVRSAVAIKKFPMLNPCFYRSKTGLYVPNGSYDPSIHAYGFILKAVADMKKWKEFLSKLTEIPPKEKFIISRKVLLSVLRKGKAVERVEAARLVGRLGILTEREMRKELERLWASGSPDDKVVAILLGFEGKHIWWEQKIIAALRISDVASPHLYPFHSTVRDAAVFTLRASHNKDLHQKAVKSLLQAISTDKQASEKEFFISTFPILASEPDVRMLLSSMDSLSSETKVVCIKALASANLLSKLPIEFLIEKLFPKVTGWLESSDERVRKAAYSFLSSILTERTKKAWKMFLKELEEKNFLHIIPNPALEMTKAVLRHGKPELKVEARYNKSTLPAIVVTFRNCGQSTIYIPKMPSVFINIAHLWSTSKSNNRLERTVFLHKRKYTPCILYEEQEVVSIAPKKCYSVEYLLPRELTVEVESSFSTRKIEVSLCFWNETPYFVIKDGKTATNKPLWCDDNIQIPLRR